GAADMIFEDDGNIYYDNGIDTLQAGTGTDNAAGVLAEPGTWNLNYYDAAGGGAYNPAADWIGTDDGGSGTYSSSADTDVYLVGGLVEDDALIDFAGDCDSAGAGTNGCFATGTLPLDATESILIDDGTAGGGAPNGVVDKQADQVIGIGVQNTGTAVDTTDIAAVKVWLDGGSAGWDGDETQLGGNMTVNSGDNQEWYLGGLTGAIPAAGTRLFVTADIAAAPTDTATLQFQLPIYSDAGGNDIADQDNDEGLFVVSGNDGPQDSLILNANTQTIDTTVPTVTTVDTIKPDGTYGVPAFMDIYVTYTSIVNVDTGGGTPTLDLNGGTAGVYNAGTGTDTLTFRYTVVDGDASGDLDYNATTSVLLNGGTIKDGALNDADNTLPAVGTFAGAHAIVIDTTGGGGGGGGGGGSAGGSSSSSSTTTTTTTTAEEPISETGLTDIVPHWAQSYIEEAYTANYVEGYEDSTFKPDQYITRAEAAKLIAMWLNMDLTDDDCDGSLFGDVACSQWYGKYVSYLHAQEIVEGYPDGTYGPGDYITRAEALKMLLYAKMLQDTDISDITNPFSDISPENWFYNTVLIGYKFSIVEGYDDGTFMPISNITRAEFTKIFVETLLNN
ncbi:S-layer homology domain-containing protein, partial [Patescibacteria group bacterium]